MTLKQYQDRARVTAIYPKAQSIIYPALGLAGEAGEVAEKIKKWIRDGNLDRDAIAKELGDVLWYIAAMATDLDLDLDRIADMNIQKLADREMRGKIRGSGDDR
jgi:NTP pyrophosphatase (non-canonical NTP hydrolase)